MIEDNVVDILIKLNDNNPLQEADVEMKVLKSRSLKTLNNTFFGQKTKDIDIVVEAFEEIYNNASQDSSMSEAKEMANQLKINMEKASQFHEASKSLEDLTTDINHIIAH